mgnify:CR=1 FL=1
MKWIAIIFAGLMVVMVVVGITIQDCGSASTVSAPDSAKSNPATVTPTKTPVELLLQSSRCYLFTQEVTADAANATYEKTYREFEGEVINATNRTLSGVKAVATYRNNTGAVVLKDITYIDAAQIFEPGQTSTFHGSAITNQIITSCEITFEVEGNAITPRLGSPTVFE